jgi:hypothetical protein
MRRLRSAAIGAIVVAALVVGAIALDRPLDTVAPTLDAAAAGALLDRASAAIASGKLQEVVDLIAPGADVLGRPPEVVRQALTGVSRSLGGKRLRLVWGRPTVMSSEGDRVSISATLDVGEQVGQLEAHYLHMPLVIDLQRRAVSDLAGLRVRDEWQIVRVTSPVSIDFDFWTE